MSDKFTLASSVLARLQWDYQRVVEGGNTPVKDVDRDTLQINLTSGTGAGSATSKVQEQVSLTPGSPSVNLDLQNLVDVFGRTIDLSYVQGLLIENLGIPDGEGGYTLVDGFDVTVGDGTDDTYWSAPFGSATGYEAYPWASQLIIPPGGVILLGCPGLDMPVGGAAGHLLKIAYTDLGGSSAQVDVDVTIIGQ